MTVFPGLKYPAQFFAVLKTGTKGCMIYGRDDN
jgi:hypothetical protein